MQYSRRRATLSRILSLPLEATLFEIRCAIRCSYWTPGKWIKKWKMAGKVNLFARREGSIYLVKRDMLLNYLISIGRVHPPKEYGLPDKEEALKIIVKG